MSEQTGFKVEPEKEIKFAIPLQDPPIQIRNLSKVPIYIGLSMNGQGKKVLDINIDTSGWVIEE